MKLKKFTLIEIVIVLVIVSILISTAVPSYLKTADKARAVEIKSELDTLNQIIGQYIMKEARFPNDIRTLVTCGLLDDFPLDPYNREYIFDKKEVYNSFSNETEEVYFLQSEAYYYGQDLVTPTIEVRCGTDPGDE